jgi:dienelactone hydrolase
MSWLCRVSCSLIPLLVVLSTSSVIAQTFPPPQKLAVSTLTLTDSDFLQGRTQDGKDATIGGILQLPGADEGYPVVILLHGSGGDGSAYGDWADLLRKAGIASFRLDSYSGRGIEEIFSDQGRLGEFYAVYDAFRAAEALAENPAIDARRIAVMGFSRGGIGALYSAMTRFEEQYGPTGVQIVAHIPFYPPCNFQLKGELELTDAPMRAFHGEGDEWNPLPRCRDYIDRLAAAGHNAQLASYPKALHAFDNAMSPAYTANAEAQTSRNCFRIEENGALLNADTMEPFSWTDACVENGPSQQFQREAAYAAREAVVEFLRGVFRL